MTQTLEPAYTVEVHPQPNSSIMVVIKRSDGAETDVELGPDDFGGDFDPAGVGLPASTPKSEAETVAELEAQQGAKK